MSTSRSVRTRAFDRHIQRTHPDISCFAYFRCFSVDKMTDSDARELLRILQIMSSCV